MKCPNCNVTLTMADRSGIEIDYCPDCRGVWLDRGELDKIIERSFPTVKNTAPSSYTENPRYSKEYYHPKKKKSLLSDLFDF
nr:hypothetical protein [Cytophagales bacterium]